MLQHSIWFITANNKKPVRNATISHEKKETKTIGWKQMRIDEDCPSGYPLHVNHD